LAKHGWHIQRLVRRDPTDPASEIGWDPSSGQVDAAALEGVDAVVHLAGENVSRKRWTSEFKETIRSSRVDGTRGLAGALAALSSPPVVMVAASAVGYYGDRSDETLTEDSAPGSGFLPDVCSAWEAATSAAAEAGIRVVNLRLGVVLSADGGALSTMLRPFRLGLGGPMGSGRQYLSWIHIDDLTRVIKHTIERDLTGPVNATSPHPVPNAEFAMALGSALRRPAFMRMPTAAVKAAFGQMGEDLLLASARVQPAKLQQAGFEFEYPEIAGALQSLLS
jgi:uncharacterized protein (TIGR01777 family)